MFHLGAEDVAGDASEVLVAGEAHEAVGLGEHPDEADEQSAANSPGQVIRL